MFGANGEKLVQLGQRNFRVRKELTQVARVARSRVRRRRLIQPASHSLGECLPEIAGRQGGRPGKSWWNLIDNQVRFSSISNRLVAGALLRRTHFIRSITRRGGVGPPFASTSQMINCRIRQEYFP